MNRNLKINSIWPIKRNIGPANTCWKIFNSVGPLAYLVYKSEANEKFLVWNCNNYFRYFPLSIKTWVTPAFEEFHLYCIHYISLWRDKLREVEKTEKMSYVCIERETTQKDEPTTARHRTQILIAGSQFSWKGCW